MNRLVGVIGLLGVIASIVITVVSKAFASQPNRASLLLAIAGVTTLGLIATIMAAKGRRVGAWGLLSCGAIALLAWPYQIAGVLFIAAAGFAFFSPVEGRSRARGFTRRDC